MNEYALTPEEQKRLIELCQSASAGLSRANVFISLMQKCIYECNDAEKIKSRFNALLETYCERLEKPQGGLPK
jgi:hypothetical protein